MENFRKVLMKIVHAIKDRKNEIVDLGFIILGVLFALPSWDVTVTRTKKMPFLSSYIVLAVHKIV